MLVVLTMYLVPKRTATDTDRRPFRSSSAPLPFAPLKALSPAEKYDIFMGKFSYPTVKFEWARTSASHPQWYGLCHGWAPAAIVYDEPNPVTLTGPSGVKVPFGSSDVKALLTHFLANYGPMSLRQVRVWAGVEEGGREHFFLKFQTSC